MNNKTICPICKNQIGFVCGTCIECGYNYLDKGFHFIEVIINDLKYLLSDEELRHLIAKHKNSKSRNNHNE